MLTEHDVREILVKLCEISTNVAEYYGHIRKIIPKYKTSWQALEAEEYDRHALFVELNEKYLEDPFNFEVLIDFDKKAVTWMSNDIATHLEKIIANKIDGKQAVNFIWDVERSHIRDQSCRFLRAADVHLQASIRQMSSLLANHKKMMMEIYYDQPEETIEQDVKTVNQHLLEKVMADQSGKSLGKIGQRIKLPHAAFAGSVSIEECLLVRRSIKEYSDQPVTLDDAAQLLWAGQGITDPRGFRTAPSGMALFPLDIRLVAGNIKGLSSGIYRYDPFDHELERLVNGDHREHLAWATYDQDWMKHAAFFLVISAFETPAAGLTAEQVERFVSIEAGHTAQNIFLQAAALGVGMVGIGHFGTDRLTEVFKLKSHERPIYVLVGGRRK